MMRKVPSKHIHWLAKELPVLEQAGVIDSGLAVRVRSYYAEQTVPTGGSAWAVTVFAVLGALLIGGGIILLFANNWDELSRNTRAVLSFLPLLLGVVASATALGRGSAAWRESAGIFHALSVGSAIALIGQTYHLPSDAPAFLLTWAVLAAPLIFLLNSTGACLVYLALATAWAGFAQRTYGQAAGYWLLLVPALLHLALLLRRDRHAQAALAAFYGVLFSVTIALGTVFERTVPGLWTVAYAALLTGVYLIGLRYYATAEGWANPPKLFGVIGIACLAYLFTWTHFWEDIGWHYRRMDWRYQEWGIWADGAATLALAGGWAAAAIKSFKRNSAETLMLSLFPALAALCFAAGSLTKGIDTLNALVFNAYFLVLGILFVALGCKELSLRRLNGGMALLAALIITRFFDDDFGFLARGIAFILLGGCFLAANLVIARKKREVIA